MENGESLNDNRITADKVISKLKDDGDFDKLRLKIIRKIKENEDLRNSIMSTVKQSKALNRPGAENMKPRQLSDAIHQEVGDIVMSKISEGLWEIIKSADGMKAEIRETVKSVYNKLSNPKGNEDVESPPCSDVVSPLKGLDNATSLNGPTNETEDTLSDSELKEPPDSLCDHNQNNNEERALKDQQLAKPLVGRSTEDQKDNHHRKDDSVVPDNLDPGAPPGFSSILNHKQPCDDSDEDPDVPPGFG